MLATMQALEGRRAHLTHIQFHSYGGEADDQSKFRSQVPELADYVNAHANLTVDVGQVLFGETTSMTADGPLGYYLHKVTGRKWTNADTEMESGCGIVPIARRAMFELPRFVLKAGRVVAEQGEIRAEMYGPTLHVATPYDEAALADIKKWFESYYTVQFANYPVEESYLAHGAVAVPCG